MERVKPLRFLKRNKKIILLILSIVCASLIFLSTFFNLSFVSNSFGFVIIPIEKVFGSSLNWISSKFHLATNLFEIENENIRLKEQIEQYNLNEERYKMLEAENKKLADLFNISQHYADYKMTGAHVIAKDTGSWFSIFIIDKGFNQGLKNNMVVMDANGLVGKIAQCYDDFAKVYSIIDDKSSVSIKNFRTDDLGFVKGDLKLKDDCLCQLEFLDNTAEIIEGDEIVTSNLSEIYPPGLLIGHVKKILNDPNKKTALLEPAADLKHLEHVLIITNEVGSKKNFDMEE